MNIFLCQPVWKMGPAAVSLQELASGAAHLVLQWDHTVYSLHLHHCLFQLSNQTGQEQTATGNFLINISSPKLQCVVYLSGIALKWNKWKNQLNVASSFLLEIQMIYKNNFPTIEILVKWMKLKQNTQVTVNYFSLGFLMNKTLNKKHESTASWNNLFKWLWWNSDTQATRTKLEVKHN